MENIERKILIEILKTLRTINKTIDLLNTNTCVIADSNKVLFKRLRKLLMVGLDLEETK